MKIEYHICDRCGKKINAGGLIHKSIIQLGTLTVCSLGDLCDECFYQGEQMIINGNDKVGQATVYQTELEMRLVEENRKLYSLINRMQRYFSPTSGEWNFVEAALEKIKEASE